MDLNNRFNFTLIVSTENEAMKNRTTLTFRGKTEEDAAKAKERLCRFIQDIDPMSQASRLEAVERCLNGYPTDGAEGTATTAAQATEWENPAARLDTSKAEAEIRPTFPITVTVPRPKNEMDPQVTEGKTPSQLIKARKKPKGAIFLKCPECGRRFGTFLKEPQEEIECRCGHHIQLDNLARYAYDCPCCERRRFGWTNLEDPEITQACVCGNEVALTWNKSAREYQG